MSEPKAGAAQGSGWACDTTPPTRRPMRPARVLSRQSCLAACVPLVYLSTTLHSSGDAAFLRNSIVRNSASGVRCLFLLPLGPARGMREENATPARRRGVCVTFIPKCFGPSAAGGYCNITSFFVLTEREVVVASLARPHAAATDATNPLVSRRPHGALHQPAIKCCGAQPATRSLFRSPAECTYTFCPPACMPTELSGESFCSSCH